MGCFPRPPPLRTERDSARETCINFDMGTLATRGEPLQPEVPGVRLHPELGPFGCLSWDLWKVGHLSGESINQHNVLAHRCPTNEPIDGECKHAGDARHDKPRPGLD